MRHFVWLGVTLGMLGCGSNNSSQSFFGTDAGTPDAGGSQAPSGDDGGIADAGSVPCFCSADGSFQTDAAPAQVAVVYGESPDSLYSLDPDTKAVTVIGAFSGCSEVEDIALDKDSNMYGTTSSALYKIDRKTAVCTKIASGSYPNSLSFVPAGTLDPSVEALVGYNGAEYVRIDTTTGAVTEVGTIGSGLQSSGDIVSVNGGSTYLTVTGTGCSTNDCLIEVNPSTGALVKNWGSVSHNQVFGLAFWAGSLFGFDDGGDLFEIDFTKTGTITTTAIPVPNPPSGLEFWGAGSTTSAPVTAPPK